MLTEKKAPPCCSEAMIRLGGKWLILACFAVVAAGWMMPTGRVFDGEPFTVREELTLLPDVVAKNEKPFLWFDVSPDGGGRDQIEVSGKNADMGRGSTSPSRFHLSFSRYSLHHMAGEKGWLSDRDEGARFIVDSLFSVFRDGPGRNTIDALGSGLQPQINLRWEF